MYSIDNRFYSFSRSTPNLLYLFNQQLSQPDFQLSALILLNTNNRQIYRLLQSFQHDFMQQHSHQPNISWQDFVIECKLGEGTYGYVFLASKNAQEYALKEMGKHKLKRQHSQHLPLVERQILKTVNHPGIVKSHFFFQTQSKFYMGLELCYGGSLQDLIIGKKINENSRRFYLAQLVNTLEYLHTNGIVHRDLKPSNLMLTQDHHLKLIDFGTACIQNSRLISQSFKDRLKALKGHPFELREEQKWEECIVACGKIRRRRSSFVGTSLYVSPELLELNECNAPADLWALGCLLYYFYFGVSPFADNSEFKVYQKIKEAKFTIPQVLITRYKNEELNEEAKDLILRLLVKNPSQRLGSCSRQQLSFSALKKHPYLADIDVDKIYQNQAPVVETVAQEQTRQWQNIRTLFLASPKHLSWDVLVEEIVIWNTQDEDTICRLVVKRDGFINLFEFTGVWEQEGKAFELRRAHYELIAFVLSNKKILIEVQAAEPFVFTTHQPQTLAEIINSSFPISIG